MSLANDLLPKVKKNLILSHDLDDTMILDMIRASIDYAELYQHQVIDFYSSNDMPASTEQAIIMLATHFYESRDGSTGGFFGDNTQAATQAKTTIDNMLRLNRVWGV